MHYDYISAVSNSYLRFFTLDFLLFLDYNDFMKEIEAFKLNNGKIPFEDWLCGLDTSLRRRIAQRLIRFEEEDYYGDYKIIDNEIKELRFKFGSGYRIYFYETSDVIILLLCGGDKSTQSKDIQKAKEYLKIWKGQNNGKKI